RLTLQVPHEINQPAVDHARIGPLALERRRRCDVLGHGVDEGGERLDLAARPEPGPLVVTAAAEYHRVLGCNESGAAGIRLLVPIGDEPIGSLSHSIERQEVARDDLARGHFDTGQPSSRNRGSWAASCSPTATGSAPCTISRKSVTPTWT